MKITILTYHELARRADDNRYSLREDDFYSQVKFLYDNGYKGVTVDRYFELISGKSTDASKKIAVISFDDGHETDFSFAFPILKKFGFKATFFITTEWIDKPRFITRDQLINLHKGGMSIQSHAKTHGFLDEMDREEIQNELWDSKNVLENIIGENVSFVSFPGGRYNKKVIECAKNLGYSAVFTSVPYYFGKSDNIYLIGRHMVKQRTNINTLINNNVVTIYKVRCIEFAKYLLRKSLGNSMYHLMWEKFMGTRARHSDCRILGK